MKTTLVVVLLSAGAALFAARLAAAQGSSNKTDAAALCSCGDQRKCCYGSGNVWCCNKDEQCVDTPRGCKKNGKVERAQSSKDVRKALSARQAQKQSVCTTRGCKAAELHVPTLTEAPPPTNMSVDPSELQSPQASAEAGVWCSAYGWINGQLFAVVGNWVGNCQGALNKARQCWSSVTQVWCPNGYILCPAPVLLCQ